MKSWKSMRLSQERRRERKREKERERERREREERVMESHAHAHAHGDCCGGSVWWTRAFTVFAGLVLYNTAKGWWYKISSYAPKLEEFDNKVLWITGASSGIGKELAR